MSKGTDARIDLNELVGKEGMHIEEHPTPRLSKFNAIPGRHRIQKITFLLLTIGLSPHQIEDAFKRPPSARTIQRWIEQGF